MLPVVPLALQEADERGHPGTYVVRSNAWVWVTAPVLDAGVGLWVVECEDAQGRWAPPFKTEYRPTSRRAFRGASGLMDGGATVVMRPEGPMRVVLVRWDITERGARDLSPAAVEPLLASSVPQVRMAAIAALGWARSTAPAEEGAESRTVQAPQTRSSR